MDYLVANLAQALPMSLPGLIVIYFYRRKIGSAVLAGAIGSALLPLFGYLSVMTPNIDIAFFSSVWGALFGGIWGMLMQGNMSTASGTSATPTSTLNLSQDMVAVDSTGKDAKHSDGDPQLTEISIQNETVFDMAEWETVKEFDKSVSSAFEQVQSLGEPWASRFARRVLDAPPHKRDALSIANEIQQEYEKSTHLSSNPEINQAYKQVAEQFGSKGQRKFEEIYRLVGDEIDIDKTIKRIESEHEINISEDHDPKPPSLNATFSGASQKTSSSPTDNLSLLEWIVVLAISGNLAMFAGSAILDLLGN